MLFERPIDPPQDGGYSTCDVCGARSSDSHEESCDERAHEEHEEDLRLEGLALTVICPECTETYTAEGCPCGHIEPDPNAFSRANGYTIRIADIPSA
jgi:hypothetical protein